MRKRSRNIMLRTLFLCGLMLLVAGCGGGFDEANIPTEVVIPTRTPADVIPTRTPLPTNTPPPTRTPLPTNTPTPDATDTPEPSATPTLTNTPQITPTDAAAFEALQQALTEVSERGLSGTPAN